jgi:hypothetical protein
VKAQLQALVETLVAEQVRGERKKSRPPQKSDRPQQSSRA